MSRDKIDKLQTRYAKFKEQKTRVETQLEVAQGRLAELQTQAKAEFGTDDVDALQKMLAKMKKENEQKQSDYQKLLDGIEDKLKQVETEFADAEQG